MAQKSPSPVKRLTLILLLVILLPALFFSGYQITTITKSEEMMVDLYQRQLDAILYSVNQYSLGVVQSWNGTLAGVLVDTPPSASARTTAQQLCDRTTPLMSAWTFDSTLQHTTVRMSKTGIDTEQFPSTQISSLLRSNREKIDRLKGYSKANYRKVEPLLFQLADGHEYLLMVFVTGTEPDLHLAGLIVDQYTFIQSVIRRRLEDAASTGLLREGDETPILPTSQVSSAALVQHKPLWLLPGYSIGVRFAGKSIDEIVSSRFAMNLTVVVLLDILLLAGGILLYRNLRKEMELAAMKANFVSNVSHELRTPLSLIRMYAETLEMGRVKEPAKQKQYYTTIVREAERLTRLVASILNFSRMEMGKREYQFAVVSLNEIVGKVLTMYSLELREKGFLPIVELSEPLPSVHADGEAVTEALINIIENAVKYSDKDTYLRVRTECDGQNVVVAVDDHGVGINEHHQPRIFDMFYRVDTGPVHNAQGTGIGLALVRHIMDAHGGSVQVQSQPGKGSTFRLVFPLERNSKKIAH